MHTEARWVVGVAMMARGEFSFLVAETARKLNFLSAESYAVVIWALLWATLTSPLFFRFALKNHVRKDYARRLRRSETQDSIATAVGGGGGGGGGGATGGATGGGGSAMSQRSPSVGSLSLCASSAAHINVGVTAPAPSDGGDGIGGSSSEGRGGRIKRQDTMDSLLSIKSLNQLSIKSEEGIVVKLPSTGAAAGERGGVRTHEELSPRRLPWRRWNSLGYGYQYGVSDRKERRGTREGSGRGSTSRDRGDSLQAQLNIREQRRQDEWWRAPISPVPDNIINTTMHRQQQQQHHHQQQQNNDVYRSPGARPSLSRMLGWIGECRVSCVL